MVEQRVLITGGSGYLGQHLLVALLEEYKGDEDFSLAFTYRTEPPPVLPEGGRDTVEVFRCDFSVAAASKNDSTTSIASVIGAFKPTVIVHTAAMSSPAACAKAPAAALEANAPAALIDGAEALPSGSRKPLIVYLSTDQVNRADVHRKPRRAILIHILQRQIHTISRSTQGSGAG